MNYSAFKDRRSLPVHPRTCLRVIGSDGTAFTASRATAIRYLAIQAHGHGGLNAVLFRTWKTADVAANGCGRCNQCSAVHYGDGLSACGLPLTGPLDSAAEALDFSPDGL